MSIINVRVGIVPCPMDKLHRYDIIRYINEYNDQSNGDCLSKFPKTESGHTDCGSVDKGWVCNEFSWGMIIHSDKTKSFCNTHTQKEYGEEVADQKA